MATKSIDLSVRWRGITFPNPVITGSSEIADDAWSTEKCLANGVGGVVTKTYTYQPEMRTRPKPYHAHFAKFGLPDSWITFVRLDTKPWELALRQELPQMVSMCKKAKVPLIGSIAQTPEPERMLEMAIGFENIGCDALEVDSSCPQTDWVKDDIPQGTTCGESHELMERTIKLLAAKIDIPVIYKLSPLFEPPAYYAKIWLEAGADAITAHNAPTGMMIDIEKEEPFCAPYVCGYLPGRAYVPISIGRIVEIKRAFPDAVIMGLGGVYEPQDVIMYLLAGSLTAGAVSSAYQHGREIFPKLVNGLEDWMAHKGYTSVEQFAGKALERVGEPAPESHPIPFPIPELPSDIIAKVNIDSCTFCNLCVVCPYEAIKISSLEQTLDIDEDRCWGCGYCVGLCPEADTLYMIDKNTDEVVWDNKGIAKALEPIGTRSSTAKTADELIG